jgi:hypothetical protein
VAQNDDAIFGSPKSPPEVLGDKLGKTYGSWFTTSEQRPANMDMPVNVPVDDPNADTEWYQFLLFSWEQANGYAS